VKIHQKNDDSGLKFAMPKGMWHFKISSRTNKFWGLFTVELLFVCLTLFSQALLGAQIPNGWESYLDRPDILKVSTSNDHRNSNNSEALMQAQFSFVAQLLALYPADTDLYFLARDSEYLYDIAKMATEGTAAAKRIHLVNVSRANMHDPKLNAYLAQNGISDQTLAAGKKVVFIDTGFAGTIPRVILSGFQQFKEQFKTHLIVSSNPGHPSSRTFLGFLNPAINEFSPSALHGTIVNYEYMARYTDRSSTYYSVDGVLHPISSTAQGTGDGLVSKPISLLYMQDLQRMWRKTQTRSDFAETIRIVKSLKARLLEGSTESINSIKQELEQSKGTLVGRQLESHLRDIFDAQKNLDFTLSASLQDFGLKAPSASNYFNKNLLIEKFPEWAPVLEDPAPEIEKLFAKENWQMIGNLIDANVDAEINKILENWLFESSSNGPRKLLQLRYIETADNNKIRSLIDNVFSKEHSLNLIEPLKRLIQKSNSDQLVELVNKAFSRAHSAGWKQQLTQIIEKADQRVLSEILNEVFSKEFSKTFADLLPKVLEKVSSNNLSSLAPRIFSKPHSIYFSDSLMFLIDRADQTLLKELTDRSFMGEHAKNWQPYLLAIIAKADTLVLQNIATVLSQAHTAEWHEAVQALMNRNDRAANRYLANFTFSAAHAVSHTAELMFLIQNASPDTLYSLATTAFTRPHTKQWILPLKLFIEIADTSALGALRNIPLFRERNPTPEVLALKKSLSLPSYERKKFLDQELRNLQAPITTKKISCRRIHVLSN
jgi:hypothetical protein